MKMDGHMITLAVWDKVVGKPAQETVELSLDPDFWNCGTSLVSSLVSSFCDQNSGRWGSKEKFMKLDLFEGEKTV